MELVAHSKSQSIKKVSPNLLLAPSCPYYLLVKRPGKQFRRRLKTIDADLRAAGPATLRSSRDAAFLLFQRHRGRMRFQSHRRMARPQAVGVLVAKTYCHLGNEHTAAMALRITFDANAADE
jgi:hypothetical protein